MTAHNLNIFPLRFIQGTVHHTMGYGICKQYHHIRITDLLLQIAGDLRKNLSLTVILLSNLFIFTYHTVMAPYNN